MPPESLNIQAFKTYLNAFKIAPDSKLSLKGLFDKLLTVNEVKANFWRFRGVYRLETTEGNYYLKLTEALRTKDKIRHLLLPRRKWTEWRNLLKLTGLGLNAAQPCLRGIRNGKGPLAFFIVIKEIKGRGLDVANINDAAAMGEFVAVLHRAGVYMADLQQGNLLVTPAGRIGFFDVQRLSFMPLMTKYWRLRNIGFFLLNLARNDVPTAWHEAFLAAYNVAGGKSFTTDDLNRAVQKAARRYAAKHDKRRFKQTGEIIKIKAGALSGLARRGYLLDWDRVLERLSPENSIKEQRVFKIDELVIKRFPRRFLHADRCLNAFKMAFELTRRQINTPQSIAYLKKGAYSYYVSKFLTDAVTANSFFSALVNVPDRKRRLIGQFARWVSMIHDQNIFQHDFKSCNVLCWHDQFYMVDLEGIRLRTPAFDDKVYNLAQLNASMSRHVSLKDRLRFFKAYADLQKLPVEQRREIIMKIWTIMLKKNTAYYDLAPENLWPVKTTGDL